MTIMAYYAEPDGRYMIWETRQHVGNYRRNKEVDHK